jgi:hypothetical protein
MIIRNGSNKKLPYFYSVNFVFIISGEVLIPVSYLLSYTG